MPYEAEISRGQKTLFVFLLDQSGSMEEPIGGTGERKDAAVANAINSWIHNIIIRATGDEGVKDWMDVAVIGYRTDQDGNAIIESALGGSLAGRELVTLAELHENAQKHPVTETHYDEDSGETIEMETEAPFWVVPVADCGTPMCSALHRAYEIIDNWCNQDENKASFPPTLIHFTDGESIDGDPSPYAEPIMDLRTDDGEALAFNCHLSAVAADTFIFPNNNELMPEQYAQDLYKMSSKLPESIYQRAVADGIELQPNARGMAYNADMVQLIRFLDMGTRVVTPDLR
jgi:hypothetical protein